MKEFEMCPECGREYVNPDNRRFHAQTNACWNCGPKITLVDKNKTPVCKGKDVYNRASKLLRAGKIIAIKGEAAFSYGPMPEMMMPLIFCAAGKTARQSLLP